MLISKFILSRKNWDLIPLCTISYHLIVFIYLSHPCVVALVKMTPLESSEVMLQAVASPRIFILTTLEVSFMLPDNTYSRGITHDNHNLLSPYFHSTGHMLNVYINKSWLHVFEHLFGTAACLCYYFTPTWHHFCPVSMPPEWYQKLTYLSTNIEQTMHTLSYIHTFYSHLKGWELDRRKWNISPWWNNQLTIN